jgi:acyl-CoA thioester hydrolase
MNECVASGQWHDRTHLLWVRVYYADTDAGGVVYHSTYLDFAERARTEMLRSVNRDPTWRPGRSATSFVVRNCEITYKRPALLDDLLEVRSHLIALGGASFTVRHDICRDGEVLVWLGLTLACVRQAGIPTRIPGPLRASMAIYLSV